MIASRLSFAALLLLAAAPLNAQNTPAQRPAPVYSRADTLRGDWKTPARAWWDVTFYDLHVRVQPSDSSIRGYNAITYKVLKPATQMQIDLMEPLKIDSMIQDGRRVNFTREGPAFFATLTSPQAVNASKTITVYYSGKPTIAKRPPWDGGFTWTQDSAKQTWIVTTDQGMGASAWWPNKDTQAEEPDSQRIAITVPKPLMNISNGRLRKTTDNPDNTTTYEWFVTNPINNYAIAIATGVYEHWNYTYAGEKGPLTMDFYPLKYNLNISRRVFPQSISMMKCFEHWFGPYPWYEDGYKLVEVPNPGMEHQSGVSYGNYYENGYRRRDQSGTGLGLGFDFIIVHESAHEWFANNITAKDQADMWVHESFANYAEGIYAECLYGKEAGSQYIVGARRGISNDAPIIPPAYNVNAQGSGDMYPKGGNMIHTIRQIVNNDERWRLLLRGMSSTFYHQTVMGSQIEKYFSTAVGMDLSKVFDQYLRTTMIPVLEYRLNGSTLSYRWSNVVPGFNMPVRATTAPGTMARLMPTTTWKTITTTLKSPADFKVDVNYYVTAKKVD